MTCKHCTRPLPDPKATGRPRQYCTEACRLRARRARHSAEAVQARHLAELAEWLDLNLETADGWTPAHARVDRPHEGDEGREVGERSSAPGARPSSDGPQEPGPSRKAPEPGASCRDLPGTPRADRPSPSFDPADPGADRPAGPPAPSPDTLEDEVSQTRKQRHRQSAPPPAPRASFGRAALAPGLNTIDGVPILRLDRAAFDALDGRRVIVADDLAALDLLDTKAAL